MPGKKRTARGKQGKPENKKGKPAIRNGARRIDPQRVRQMMARFEVVSDKAVMSFSEAVKRLEEAGIENEEAIRRVSNAIGAVKTFLEDQVAHKYAIAGQTEVLDELDRRMLISRRQMGTVLGEALISENDARRLLDFMKRERNLYLERSQK